jgi:hypothetical protein
MLILRFLRMHVVLLYIYCKDDIPGALFDHLELNRRSKVREILQVTNATMTKETEIHPSIYYLSSSSLLDRPLILLDIRRFITKF